ncbi:MAG TPA: hypothetical protein VLK33_00305 [Terriglobales bacterium]|nr:hypothetical protein [Terriglobales bacterium]
MDVVTLYHVSPRSNFDSIMELGVSPAFSVGRKACIWLVEFDKLAWAMAHVSERKDVSVLHLLVFTVAPAKPELRRAPWHGVFQCLSATYPTNVMHAGDILRAIEAEDKHGRKAVRL